MANKLFWNIFAGGFLGASGLVSISCSALVVYSTLVRRHAYHFILGIVVVGLLLVLFGFWKLHRKRTANPQSAAPTFVDIDHPLAFFSRLEFWGAVVLVSAVPVFIFSHEHVLKVAARPPPVVVVQKPAPAPPPAVAAPPQLPPLHLQGLVCNGENSTALIDGQTLKVGEFVEGARLVAVEQSGVTVEFSGATNFLRLE